MIEKLAGRLTWERSGQGILVEIPETKSYWMIGLSIVWLAFSAMIVAGMFVATPTFGCLGFALFLLLVPGFGFVFLYRLVENLTGRTTLALDPLSLQITRRVAGIKLRVRTFRTAAVRNPRYVYEDSVDYGYSAIRFESGNKSRAFAAGIRETDAQALIDKIIEICPFLKGGAAA
jgi:hypothetical protein